MTSMLQFHSREVVLCSDIAPVIKEWLGRQGQAHKREWGCSMEMDKNRAFRGIELIGGGGYGPLSRLAFEAKMSERRIWGILAGEQVSVGLDVADRLMMAMDLHVNDLPICCAREVREATEMQTELLRQVVRCRGGYVGTGKAARNDIPRYRKLFAKAA